MLAIIPMACAALLYGAKLVWPVKVYADGLRCYDESGRYHTVNWHDITSVKRVRLFGLVRMVYIKSAHVPKPVTVPLHLEDMEAFIRVIETQAGRTNVLARALRGDAR
jgi:hypothetical protein